MSDTCYHLYSGQFTHVIGFLQSSDSSWRKQACNLNMNILLRMFGMYFYVQKLKNNFIWKFWKGLYLAFKILGRKYFKFCSFSRLICFLFWRHMFQRKHTKESQKLECLDYQTLYNTLLVLIKTIVTPGITLNQVWC